MMMTALSDFFNYLYSKSLWNGYDVNNLIKTFVAGYWVRQEAGFPHHAKTDAVLESCVGCVQGSRFSDRVTL